MPPADRLLGLQATAIDDALSPARPAAVDRRPNLGDRPMISHGEGFIVRHESGRYFNSDCHYPGFAAGRYDPAVPIAIIYRLVKNPFEADLVRNREFCGRWLQHPEWASVADQFEIVPGPACACCGERGGTMWGDGDQYRCTKHKDRNPCAVEGCRRTRSKGQGGYHNDAYLCAEHFKIAAPPGSAERRVYNRLWRLHRKRDGKDAPWSPELNRRLWRVWFRLVGIARARSAGDIDMDEINKMFGWAE